MIKKMQFSITLILVVIVYGLPGIADAASPWKWMYSLKSEKKDLLIDLPTSVFVDVQKERYYISDAGSGAIHSYDKLGKHLNTFKPGKTLDQPFAMVRDTNGVLWTVEKGKNTLTRIDLKNKKIDPKELEVDGRRIYPDRMILYKNLFYILDKFSGAIFVFDENLQNSKRFSCSECNSGFIDFIIKEDKVWGLVREEEAVYQFDNDGKFLGKVELKKSFAFPYALEIGSSGLLYILDRHEGAVSVFDQSGQFKYSFLKKGHSRGSLYYPEDLLFDPWGRLCIVDSGNGRVEVYSR